MTFRLVAMLQGPAGHRIAAGASAPFEADSRNAAWAKINLETVPAALFGGVELIGLQMEEAVEAEKLIAAGV